MEWRRSEKLFCFGFVLFSSLVVFAAVFKEALIGRTCVCTVNEKSNVLSYREHFCTLRTHLLWVFNSRAQYNNSMRAQIFLVMPQLHKPGDISGISETSLNLLLQTTFHITSHQPHPINTRPSSGPTPLLVPLMGMPNFSSSFKKTLVLIQHRRGRRGIIPRKSCLYSY